MPLGALVFKTSAFAISPFRQKMMGGNRTHLRIACLVATGTYAIVLTKAVIVLLAVANMQSCVPRMGFEPTRPFGH